MKTKILLLAAVTSVTAACSGAGGTAGGTVVGPVRAPTAATPEPTTAQTPGLTMPASSAPTSINPNMAGSFNGNGNFNRGFASTNSLYSITNPPSSRFNQPLGNAPGGAIMPQPGATPQMPSGNISPTVNTPLPATVNPQSTIVPSAGANSPANVVPPAGANSPQQPVQAPAPGANSTPPNP